MFLLQLFSSNPMAAVALLLSLATMLWCIRLLRSQHTRMDRYLMSFLGLIALYQGLRILQDNGFWSLGPNLHTISGFADAAIASLYLVSTSIFQISSKDRHNTKLQLRVVEAQHPSLRGTISFTGAGERTALAVMGVDPSGAINLWHTSSEEFFGWRCDEVMGTKLPFKEVIEPAMGASGEPQRLKLRTRRNEIMEAIVWFIPVPGGSSSLVLVLDYLKSQRAELAKPSGVRSMRRPELSPIG
jgi:hypothetical protein